MPLFTCNGKGTDSQLLTNEVGSNVQSLPYFMVIEQTRKIQNRTIQSYKTYTSTLQKRRFCKLKAAVLHHKRGSFAKRESIFQLSNRVLTVSRFYFTSFPNVNGFGFIILYSQSEK